MLSGACHDSGMHRSQQGFVLLNHSAEELANLAASFRSSCLDRAKEMRYVLLALNGNLYILASILPLIRASNTAELRVALRKLSLLFECLASPGTEPASSFRKMHRLKISHGEGLQRP